MQSSHQPWLHLQLISALIYSFSQRFILKRLFQYQAAAEAGMFQAAPYPPFSPDMLPPMMYPPFVAEKAKPPKVKAKKTAVKPKAEKEPKSSGGKATKAEKATTEGAGLSCLVYHS